LVVKGKGLSLFEFFQEKGDGNDALVAVSFVEAQDNLVMNVAHVLQKGERTVGKFSREEVLDELTA
jgi:hypothetical protein